MSQDRLTDSLCSKLPSRVQEIAMGTSVSNANSDDQFMMTFLQNHLHQRELQKYVTDETLDKTFTLTRVKKATSQKPRLRKTALSLRERRQLGLFKLKRKGMKYSDFLPLHQLWKEYFSSYLDMDTLKSHGFTADPNDKHWPDVIRMLLKADYHGAILTVKKSTCCSLVGKSGIVIMDTKNTFKMLAEDNILRTIPKQSSVFCFKHDGYTFTILGCQFCIKPSDRSSKKIKSFMNLSL